MRMEYVKYEFYFVIDFTLRNGGMWVTQWNMIFP